MSNLREFTELGHRSLTKLCVETLYNVMEPHLNNLACVVPKKMGKKTDLNPLFQQVLPSSIITRGAGSQKYKQTNKKKRLKENLLLHRTNWAKYQGVDQYQWMIDNLTRDFWSLKTFQQWKWLLLSAKSKRRTSLSAVIYSFYSVSTIAALIR